MSLKVKRLLLVSVCLYVGVVAVVVALLDACCCCCVGGVVIDVAERNFFASESVEAVSVGFVVGWVVVCCGGTTDDKAAGSDGGDEDSSSDRAPRATKNKSGKN